MKAHNHICEDGLGKVGRVPTSHHLLSLPNIYETLGTRTQSQPLLTVQEAEKSQKQLLRRGQSCNMTRSVGSGL